MWQDPPASSPSPSKQAGFRGISRLDFGMCTSVEAKHWLEGGDGPNLDRISLDASVAKKGQSSFSHQKNG